MSIVIAALLCFGFIYAQREFGKIHVELKSIRQISRDLHYFGRDRSFAIKSVSYPICICNSSSTAFGIEYDGYITDVTVLHSSCTAAERINLHETLSGCDGLDVAFTRACPVMNAAFNGTVTANLEQGDIVVSYGFGEYVMSWQGVLACLFDKNEVYFARFEGHANLPVDTFLVFGDQNKGASGAAVLNGDGLAGFASSVIAGSFKNNRMVAIIPMYHVQMCMSRLGREGKLMKVSDCPRVRIVVPPVLGSL